MYLDTTKDTRVDLVRRRLSKMVSDRDPQFIHEILPLLLSLTVPRPTNISLRERSPT